MKRMTVKLEIETEAGKVRVSWPAYLAAPGLAVHRERLPGAKPGADWMLTHILSGSYVAPKGESGFFSTRKDSARFARCLNEVVDFTLPAKDLKNHVTRGLVALSTEKFLDGHDPIQTPQPGEPS